MQLYVNTSSKRGGPVLRASISRARGRCRCRTGEGLRNEGIWPPQGCTDDDR